MEASLWIVLACLFISNFFFTSGIVYGFPGIETFLKSEGIYLSECPPGTSSSDGCSAQDAKYNLIFNLAANGATLASAQWGLTLDKFGPKLNVLIGHSLLTLGFFLLAFSNDSSFDAFIPSMVFIAWGGMANFLVSFQFAFIFPFPVLIRTVLTALYTASGILFTCVGFFIDPSSDVLSRRPIFTFWGILAAVYMIAIIAIYPSRPYSPGDKCKLPILTWLSNEKYSPLDQYLDVAHTEKPGSTSVNSPLSDNLLDDNNEGTSPMRVNVHSNGAVNSPYVPSPKSATFGNGDISSPSVLIPDYHKYSSPQWDALKANRTLIEELKDPGTTFVTLFFTVGLLFLNLYLANIGQILKDKGDSDGVYAKVFQFIFSFFPIIFSPGYTAIFNRYRYTGIILLDVITMSLCWIPLFIDNVPVQILSFVIYAFARCFLVTVLFGYLSTQYRQDHYGYLTAIATLITGIIGVPAQLGIQAAIDAAGSNNMNYLYIAFIAGTTPFLYFAWWLRARRW